MQEDFESSPILLIGFNRPDFMAAQIAAVRAARPAKLYVAVDGPRADRPVETETCRAVRDCVKLVDWPCEVKTLFSEVNRGCQMGPVSAINWFFEHEESGIVLEDDCRPTIDFLRFASEMLARYSEDERIGLIAGFNAFDLQSDRQASYHFSEHLDIWGWASWRRVWQKYDVSMSKYIDRAEELIDRSKMLPYGKMFMRKGLREVQAGLDAWDFPFSLMFLAEGYLAVSPRVKLVANAGVCEAEATHTGGYNYYAPRFAKAGKITFPLVHPEAVVCDEGADRRREQMEGAIFPRGLTWLGCKFPRLCPLLSTIGRMVESTLPIVFRYP